MRLGFLQRIDKICYSYRLFLISKFQEIFKFLYRYIKKPSNLVFLFKNAFLKTSARNIIVLDGENDFRYFSGIIHLSNKNFNNNSSFDKGLSRPPPLNMFFIFTSSLFASKAISVSRYSLIKANLRSCGKIKS